MDGQLLIELTGDIVSAHVENNQVPVGDVAKLIQQVHQALSGLGQESASASPEKSPAVSVRASIKPDYIICMECGKKQKTLKRHLQSAHTMSPAEYRKDYGLPDAYPMTAPNYSEQRRKLAKTIGLGRKAKGETPTSNSKNGRKKKPLTE